MKFLIYGSKGWIGGQFINIVRTKYDDLSVVPGEARVNIVEDVERELDKVEPTHVFSFIGRTHGKIGEKTYTTIDYLEQPGKLKENVRELSNK